MDCTSKLKGSTNKAADTLISLLESESEQVRLSAANVILNQTVRFVELNEVEGRLKEIERQLKHR